MFYIKSKEDGRYYSGYSCGSIIWKDHPTRALYSKEWVYLQGVVDTLCDLLGICSYEFEIVEEK
tara:strand:+ start:72383 stop:72574 length:192 start_codon:yes stop_codon:yes gene_type:complete